MKTLERLLLLLILLLLNCLACYFAEAVTIPEAAPFAARAPGPKRKPEHDRPGLYPKYFHEPNGNQLLHHYDSRYMHKQLSYADKQDTQIHMMRAYLEFFRAKGIETWLAHGTLLGWWWNGQMLPWDWDVDTQVSITSLEYLAKNFNSTIYTYTSKAETGVSPSTKTMGILTRQYHLDINPAMWIRHYETGHNLIDARWIDVRNGLYVDITGVAEMQPKEQPGIWSCKNFHEYRAKDLWPMRETKYEGVVAKVPYAYERLLLEEYGDKAFVMEDYQGHKWNAADRVWVRGTRKEMGQKVSYAKAARRKKYEEQAAAISRQWRKTKHERWAIDRRLKEKEDREREGRPKEADDSGSQYER